MPKKIIKQKGLHANKMVKSIRGRTIINEVSFYVETGEVVALLGPNGAGKTSCFHSIIGLVEIDSGEITLDGKDLTHWPVYRRARAGLGYLPQEASAFRGLTVEQNIRAVLEVVCRTKNDIHNRLEELLNDFSIQKIRNSPATALSGGERRRLEIARALAANPEYMLLDEPFAGVDPIAVGDIRALVKNLTSRGLGVLITDHNVREALSIVDRAYILHEGRVIMSGTPKDIVANKEVKKVYLGENFKL